MICNTIGLTADSFESIYTTGGTEVEEVYGAIDYAQPIYAKIREITGTSPLTFTSRVAGTLTDYRISGETVQDGTPYPDMPVDVVGCGTKTENLFDESAAELGILATDGTVNHDGIYKTSAYCKINTGFTISLTARYNAPRILYVAYYTAEKQFLSRVDKIFYAGYIKYSYSTPAGTEYIRFTYFGRASDGDKNIMLNLGSTALPYEPYGYKLPVTVNGTEYPIYLGQVPTTRRIKKLVLTGDETINLYWNAFTTYLDGATTLSKSVIFTLSNCYKGFRAIYANQIFAAPNGIVTQRLEQPTLAIKDDRFTTAADFKSYLAAEYSAGHPVTIWYVLAEPETGIVNEPLHKIGDYADTISFAQAGVTIPTASGANVLDMTSTVKPSEVYIKGKIKPDGYGNLTDKNGVYILDKNGVQLTVHGQGTSN